MVNPFYHSAVTNVGMQEQSAAANAAMIITGLEKELNAKKVKIDFKDPQAEFKNLPNYIQKLVAATRVEKISKRKYHQEEKDAPFEFFIKLGTSLLSRKRRRAFPYIKKDKLKQIIKAKEAAFSAQVKRIDPKLLKEYMVLQSRLATKISREKQATVKQALKDIEARLSKRGLSAKNMATIKELVNEVVKAELSNLIKQKLLKHLNDPTQSLKIILSSKSSIKLLGFIFYNEATNQIPLAFNVQDHPKEKILKKIINTNLPAEIKNLAALLNFIEELNINLTAWISSWNFEKIAISNAGDITIKTNLNSQLREKSLLIDELKLLEAWKHLETKFMNKIFIYFRIREIENSLSVWQTSQEEIAQIRRQGQHVAWLKIMASLKEFHLKRVFASSYNEFNENSKIIAYLTKKARKLGKQVSKKGTHFLQIQLKKLAIDTAAYKLELLKSMQNIAPSEQTKKDIKWLTTVLNHLKSRQEQIETFEKFGNIIKFGYLRIKNYFTIKF